MREHIGLFRGKRLDNCEWVEGYLSKRPSAIQIGAYCPWYISVPPLDPDDNGGYYNVDPDTVGECTSMCDKDGKLIFEGDILHQRGLNWLVGFQRGAFAALDEKKEMQFAFFEQYDFYKGEYRFPDSFEIIGNVHDNPELMEGVIEKK